MTAAVTRSAPAGSESFNNAVHALRALATAMVFAAHMLDSFNTYFYPDHAALNLAMPYVKRLGTFGVELFFVISGYVIMSSVDRYSLREFFLRRFIRIYPVFAFFTLLFFALNAVSRAFPGKLSLVDLLLNLGFINIYLGTPALSPNAWSLTFEANFYLMAGLGCAFLRTRRVAALVALAAAALAFLAVFPIAAYFLVGCILYFVRRPTSALRSAVEVSVLLLWCLLAAVVIRTSDGPERASWAMNTLLLGATGLFFFLASGRGSVFASLAAFRPVFFLGTISYSFYLAHPYAYFALRVGFQRTGLEALPMGAAAAIYFPAMAGAALAFSYLIYRVLEVAPYRAAFGESVFKTRSAVPGRIDGRSASAEIGRTVTQG
ncbi:MAG: acyltransferase [Hyphomicrobiales bacterium]|nr:acyltransferase [Hyphomicrobiales bacterium]